MTTTRAELLSALQRRLADASGQLWTATELNGYIQEGYDDLTKRTGCLFDSSVLPDFAFAFSVTQEWEKAFLLSGWTNHGPAQFTTEFERDYLDNSKGPANHTQPWEFNSGFVDITEVAALADLPDALQEIERATWETRRVAAMRSRDVEEWDSRYELNKGQVEGYLQDKDGVGILRKYRIPSTAYAPYAFDSASDDGFGIIRDLDGISTASVDQADTGGCGDLVQVDGLNIFEDFGILGPIYSETSVLRLEYHRRGATLSDTEPFEIADRYTIYVRHYAQAKALTREGSGQELKLAKHFMDRYEAGIARMLRRKQAMAFQKKSIMGGGESIRKTRLPLARLPYQFGVPSRS